MQNLLACKHESVFQFVIRCSHDHARQMDRDDVMLTGQRVLYIVLSKETSFQQTASIILTLDQVQSKS